MVGEKLCKKCGVVKALSEFYGHIGTKDKHRSECKQCDSKQRKAEYAKNKNKHKDWSLKQNYGLSLIEYNVIWEQQCGLCAICGKPETKERTPGVVFSLAVDHNHKTGKVRGLLCCKCNRFLGLAGDSLDILISAVSYLRGVGP